jgi:hypothetical protein
MDDYGDPAPKRLKAWVDRALRLVAPDGVANRLDLYVERPGDVPRKLASWSLTGDRTYTADELADEIYGQASDEAEAALEPGQLRFTVRAFDNSSRDHLSEYPWTMPARPHTTAVSATSSQIPNRLDQGQAWAVLVRALVDSQRINAETFGPMLAAQQQMIAMLSRARLEDLEAQQKISKMQIEQLSEQERVKSEVAINEMRARREDQVFGKALDLMPLLLANILPDSNVGKALAKEGKDPARVKATDVMMNLTTSEIAAIATNLRPESRQAFMELYTMLRADALDAQKRLPDRLKPKEPTDEEVETAAKAVNNGDRQ